MHQFFEGEKYDNELKETLDGHNYYFYIVANALDFDYDPHWGSGLPEFLVTDAPMTKTQIAELVKSEYGIGEEEEEEAAAPLESRSTWGM